jgi:hypothetical protein
MAPNVSANTAVAFAAYEQLIFFRGKSNGTTTIILFNKGSVGVCRPILKVKLAIKPRSFKLFTPL